MTAFRFLEPAEEEMNQAGSFYEAASEGLGLDFLADVQFAIDRVCEHPFIGHAIDEGLRRLLLHRFPSASSILLRWTRSLSLLSRIMGAVPATGRNE